MKHSFYKYQGTGNDFIVIDNRQNIFDKNNARLVASLCDRRFGIGADGLILLEDHGTMDFKMVYFNSDGHQSSMCGNGGRCIVAFAKRLGLIDTKASFEAIDGPHYAFVDSDGVVSLNMKDVSGVECFPQHLFLDTGSPHHVQLVNDINSLNVQKIGADIRYGDLYDEAGSNVNFVEKIDNGFRIRTYERGVEGETLSCGTGATAVAIAMFRSGQSSDTEITLVTNGGNLKVKFTPHEEGFKEVWLIGPAEFVFKGELTW
ncbi:diaminopimelate epimerase [Winogradskyella aurantiaca]|uniref:diaminopimelate epimerase n=1 Tax=Winogradskyella aurantiaca TaxID=2219558 RepID=UPI000E1CD8FD|nr:diaminopimelate epimerase [Winogradskyella aurantiaca]